MGSPPLSGARTAQYHAVAATEKWQAFIAGLASDITRTQAERQRRDDERKRETTYARGELGGH
jgi:uncharacterized small protein (DUF1192 family)